ncbi:hypothetical protein ACRALDRAFT_1061925 [Sodiomyces alcalophilus JCM 7366]|uniref:uncharacterized protein n=1 Tax=Sodiomyces alcalophilus JCM 7366 TaxID=591952 RepID=UPI0039B53FB7
MKIFAAAIALTTLIGLSSTKPINIQYKDIIDNAMDGTRVAKHRGLPGTHIGGDEDEDAEEAGNLPAYYTDEPIPTETVCLGYEAPAPTQHIADRPVLTGRASVLETKIIIDGLLIELVNQFKPLRHAVKFLEDLGFSPLGRLTNIVVELLFFPNDSLAQKKATAAMIQAYIDRFSDRNTGRNIDDTDDDINDDINDDHQQRQRHQHRRRQPIRQGRSSPSHAVSLLRQAIAQDMDIMVILNHFENTLLSMLVNKEKVLNNRPRA